MPNLGTKLTNEEGVPPPTSDNQKTAVEAEKESEGNQESEGNPESKANNHTEADAESEGLPVEESDGLPGVKIMSGIELAPMDNIVKMVNTNLRNCVACKKSCLELKVDRRIGFASNWKLSCSSCDKIDQSHYNNLNHMKRSLGRCTDYTERRKEKD